MKVMVIGGTGFIGPPLVRRLVALGHEVAVFHRGQTHAELPRGVDQILGDRNELSEHTDHFRRFKPDVVVDMIAFTETDARGLIETFRRLSRRSIVISSADVYRAYGRFINLEPGPVEPAPLVEFAPLRAALFPYRQQAKGRDDFLYTYDKLPVEKVVLGDPDLPGTVLRLPMVHGPGDPYGRLSPYLKRMDDRRPCIVLDELLAQWKCPRGYVENVAAAIALAVTDDRAMSRIYNVADPVAFTETEWVGTIGKSAGWRGVIVTAPSGTIPLPYRVEQSIDTDSGRIRRELGHTEEVVGQDALERTIVWERTKPASASQGIGLLDYAAEDAILAKIGRG
jgi:nucleoside-diphosphate-sugar epimerase